MAFAAMTLAACSPKQQPSTLIIDNALTAEEISEGRLTPAVIWKMGRLGSATLSPDGELALYTVTRYNMAENRGLTQIYVRNMASGEERELTDNTSNNSDPQWCADGSKIFFTSNRSGSMQLWSMDPQGGNATQITDIEGGIEGYGVTAAEDKIFYIKSIHVADVKSSDRYEDMDKSKARIYDDLMSRHWDYWDEGDYRHVFIAEMGGSLIKQGTDIVGADAAWDAPLAPYFDAAEIAWSNDGKKLAYTCKKLTGAAYALSTDSDIYIYNTEDGSVININKPEPTAADTGEFPGYDRYPVKMLARANNFRLRD